MVDAAAATGQNVRRSSLKSQYYGMTSRVFLKVCMLPPGRVLHCISSSKYEQIQDRSIADVHLHGSG